MKILIKSMSVLKKRIEDIILSLNQIHSKGNTQISEKNIKKLRLYLISYLIKDKLKAQDHFNPLNCMACLGLVRNKPFIIFYEGICSPILYGSNQEMKIPYQE